ncbi:sulfotransferase family protein [Microbacterium karelineae]|uniref:sulfotransferase family protein n=1 Tax=Microbacterium karelineae TaxID=2654283 RepID=UPI0018D44121|nr:sulfotransferase [Microbacterium karelineae]
MLPNLIIAGTQESGTTWLHHTLKMSAHFQPPDNKELDFFLGRDCAERLDAYSAHFEANAEARYTYESSPNYYRPVIESEDVPSRIASVLGEPEIIVLFRDPVERYESAFIHHMHAGRFPYSETIDQVEDAHRMLQLGEYARITERWLERFPNIHFHLYDDLQDKPALIDAVMNELGVENDIPVDELEFEVNSAAMKQSGRKWEAMPALSESARSRLIEHYAPEVERLQALIGRDLSHWLAH